MIFSENQRYLTTRITYTIRNRIRHYRNYQKNAVIFIYIIFLKKREKVTAKIAEPWKIRIRKNFGNQSNQSNLKVTKVTKK